MITRRTFLGGLAVAAAGVPLAANGVLAQGRAGARAAMSLTLANESGRGPVWTYVVGTNLATGQQCRLSANGAAARGVGGGQRAGRLHRLRDPGRGRRHDAVAAAGHVGPDLPGDRRQAQVPLQPGQRARLPGGLGQLRPELPDPARLRGVHLRRRRDALQHHHGRHAVRAARDHADRRAAAVDRPAARRRPGRGVLRAVRAGRVRRAGAGGPARDRARATGSTPAGSRRTTSTATSTRCGRTTSRTR